MKTRNPVWLFVLTLLSIIYFQSPTSSAQGTAFTYQGRLNNNGTPAGGLYDFRFRLAADDQGNNYVGNAFLTNAIVVTNGLFTTTIDFGAGIFTGSNYWLEVDVRTNGTSGYTALNPLQAVTSVPYATFANAASNISGTVSAAQISGTVASAGLAGTYGNAVNFNSAGNSFSGAFAGDGTSISNVNAVALNGLSASNFWQLGGNVGTTAGLNYLGTSDNQPMEIHAGGLRALRLEPGGVSGLAGTGTPTGAPNVIGGSPENSVAPGTVGVVIGGGGATNWSGNVFVNSIGGYSDFSVIAGGIINTIQTNDYLSVISGGQINTIQADSEESTIGGGSDNAIQTNAPQSTIGGGSDNTIQANSEESTIGGGSDNAVQANSDHSTIGGGYDNTIQTNASESSIGGGSGNTILTNAYDSVIGGGYENTIYGDTFGDGCSFIGGGGNNTVQTNSAYSFIGGGYGNTISINSGGLTSAAIVGGYANSINGYSDFSIIGGGYENSIAGDTSGSAISGGESNLINTNSDHAFIGGGWYDSIGNNDYEGVIAGGYHNTMGDFSGYSTIVGGQYNSIGTNAGNSTIAGGNNNTISNNAANAFAAGNNARVANSGSFVWSDGSATTISVANDSVTFRASGGYRFFSGSSTGGASLAAGATSWTAISDRNAKKNFAAVDTMAVLNKLAAIPVQQWNYKWEKDSDVPNIGPMAQDFKHAFYPGRDDKGISTLEFDGVELAAIQGLNQKLETQSKDKDAEIHQLQQSVAELKAMVSQLAQKKTE